MSEMRRQRRKREKQQARGRRVRRAANMRKGGSPVGRSRMGRRPAYWRGAW